jgi:membrane fusion protein (multidrug efflux system)
VIRSPIDGVVGTSRFDRGAVIRGADKTPLTVVSRIDPLFVTFSMSALDYLTVRRRARSVGERQREEKQGKALEAEVSITLPDDTAYRFAGRVDFTDPQVAPETGTFEVRAVVPNPDRELLPGQYTRVTLPLTFQRDALLIPEQAVVIAQGGVYVMVALPTNRIERRLIVPGPVVDGRMVVARGLAEGERIVVHGINKVRHGSLVDAITVARHEAEVEAQRTESLRGPPPGASRAGQEGGGGPKDDPVQAPSRNQP